MTKHPYISFVVTSRNDNHGGDMTRRMSLFMNGLIHQTKKYKVAVELVFVEWNPPEDRPLLHEVLPRPSAEHPYFQVRYVVVPPAIHQSYRFADVLPLYQMIAKNVGIRRAKGKFVLCTNVDLLFSDGLFAFFAQKKLQNDCFYRANRCDIPAVIDINWSYSEQMTYAEDNIIQRLGKIDYYTHLSHAHPLLTKYRWLARPLDRAVGVKRKVFNNPTEMDLWNLDTYACGDFTLMSKEAWLDIQGYPELDMYSIHIDSLGLIAAAALGYKQVVLKEEQCAYHIYHENGWESMTAIEKLRFLNKRPGIGWDVVDQAGQYILKHKCRYDFNDENWGFNNVDLQEIAIN